MKRLKYIAILSALLLIPALVYSQEDLDPNSIKLDISTPYFNSQAFQSGITSTRDLGDLAKRYSPLHEKAGALDLRLNPTRPKFFMIGALYTEALAYIGSGKWDLASQRLEYLEKEFINMGAPRLCDGLITKTRISSKLRSILPKYPRYRLRYIRALLQKKYAKTKPKIS